MTETERIANKVFDQHFPPKPSPKSKEVPWDRYYQVLFGNRKGGE